MTTPTLRLIMTLWILAGIAIVLTVVAWARGAWPLAVAGWVLFGLGALIGGDIGPVAIALGALCIVLGGLSMTRGAIFDGSPKKSLPEADIPLYQQEEDTDSDVDAVHFTHNYWGPS